VIAFLLCSPDPITSLPADTEHTIQSTPNKSQRVFTLLPLGPKKEKKKKTHKKMRNDFDHFE